MTLLGALLLPLNHLRVAWSILDCARRTDTFLSCAFREQEDDQATLPILFHHLHWSWYFAMRYRSVLRVILRSRLASEILPPVRCNASFNSFFSIS